MKYLLVILSFLSFMALADAPLRVGVDPTLKPFAYTEPTGEVAGFDIDIAKEVCTKLKRECVFVPTEWDGLIPSLNARKVDILITAMSITTEREKVVDFSRPYYKSPSQLLVSQKAEVVRTVGVLRGSVDEAFARKTYSKAKIVAYGNQLEALMDLQYGRLDAVFGPRIELQYGLTTDQRDLFEFIGPVYDDLKYFGPGIGMAVRENDPLLAQVNEAIEQIRAEGLWKKHSDRYFQVDIWAY